jgi:thioredoxin 1
VNVQDLTRDTFEELAAGAGRRVVIDFWGERCAPCLALAPKYHELAEQFDELTFLRVDAPKNRMLCVDLRVMSLPTFVYLEDGRETSRLDGDVSDVDLARWIRELSERAREEVGR